MPATFSHPIAVYPFRKWKGWEGLWSALIVGSISPDLLYLYQGINNKHYGHSWVGLFTFSLPAALLTLWMWHRVMKRPLLRLLPPRDQQVLLPLCGEFRFGPPARFARIVATILFAELIHVLLDGATHEKGIFAKHIPWLNRTIVGLPSQHVWLRTTDVLYLFVSLFGALALWWGYRGWRRRAEAAGEVMEVPAHLRLSRIKRFLLLFVLLTLTILFMPYLGNPLHGGYLFFYLGEYAGAAMRAVVYLALVFSIFWNWLDSRRGAVEKDEASPAAEETVAVP